MLKLYKNTILLSGFLGAVLLIIGYSASAYMQNCCIGIACSLLVVVITTSLQYLNEHNTVFYSFKRNLRKLYLQVSIISSLTDIELNKYLNDFDIINKIAHYLDSLQNNIENLCWFNPQKKKQYNEEFAMIMILIVEFHSDRYENPERALKRLSSDSTIELLQTLLEKSVTNEADRLFVKGMVRKELNQAKDEEKESDKDENKV